VTVEITRRKDSELVWKGTLDEYLDARRDGKYWSYNIFEMRMYI
jgi:hypothetical protein